MASSARTVAERRGWPTLTRDEIDGSAREIRELAEADGACDSCPGYGRCPLPVRGLVPTGRLIGGIIQVSYGPCEEAVRAGQAAREHDCLKGADLPDGTEHMTLDSYHPGPGTAAAFRFACKFCEQDEPRRGVVFAGSTGCGKTHLAVAILRHWVGRGRRGLFRSVPNLMEILRIAQFADDEERLWETLEILRLRPVLVLDDLGTEKVTDSRLERLFQIVNDRELAGQPLIVTCNYRRPAALAERLGGLAGERIVSRLRGICEWVEMDGPDGRVDRWWER